MSALLDLVAAGKRLRACQRTYFALRRKRAPDDECAAALTASREAESAFDKMLAAIEQDAAERQPGLFGT